MSFSIAPLLLHSPAVPPAARAALHAAFTATSTARRAHLSSAARILYAEAGVDCADARELVGLAGDGDDCTCG